MLVGNVYLHPIPMSNFSSVMDVTVLLFQPHTNYMGIYHVQTNLFIQIVQTSTWTTGSTSKRVHRGVGGKICKSVIRGGRLIVKLPNPSYPLPLGAGGSD